MFLVLDHSTLPEPDDVERGFIDPDAVIHLKIGDAINDLIKRVRFSLGYELNPDIAGLDEDPELPGEFSREIDFWRALHDSNRPLKALSFETRDYTHTLMKVGDAS